jgi:hypothetical protein
MNAPSSTPAAVKIAGGKHIHLALPSSIRLDAFCKGLRSHRAINIGVSLEMISCKKCRQKAETLGLIKATPSL